MSQNYNFEPTWHTPEGRVKSTMSGPHTGQIQWLQDTGAGPWLIGCWGTPLLQTSVVFLYWVILPELSVIRNSNTSVQDMQSWIITSFNALRI